MSDQDIEQPLVFVSDKSKEHRHFENVHVVMGLEGIVESMGTASMEPKPIIDGNN